MGRSHREETKKKISRGVRRTLENKSKNRIRERYSSFFALGHPDRVIPSKVRSYGDLVRDKGSAPTERSRTGLETQEEKIARVEETANTLGLRRAENVKKGAEGVKGGVVEYVVDGPLDIEGEG
jgi:hypothetical protein